MDMPTTSIMQRTPVVSSLSPRVPLSSDERLAVFVAARVGAARSIDASPSVLYPLATAAVSGLLAAFVGVLVSDASWSAAMFASVVPTACCVGALPGVLLASVRHRRHQVLVAGIDTLGTAIARPFQLDDGRAPSQHAVLVAAMTLQRYASCQLIAEQLISKFVALDHAAFRALCLAAVDPNANGRGAFSDDEICAGLLRLATPEGQVMFAAAAEGCVGVDGCEFAAFKQAIVLSERLDDSCGAREVFATLRTDASASTSLSWAQLEELVDVSVAVVASGVPPVSRRRPAAA